MVEKHRSAFGNVVEAAKKDIGSIRTGRANPQLVEGVGVEAYGAKTPLKQLASITIPEPRTIQIEPWDKTILKDVERSLVEARLGLTPTTTGSVIRLTLSSLNTETRAELSKLVNGKIEQFKTRLRSLRDKVREEVTQAEKVKTITQDDRYEAYQDVDALTREFTEQLKELLDRKVAEINTL